jgi:hypothetical protein
VPKTPIGAQIHQTFDIHGYITPQVPFHLALFVNNSPDPCDLLTGEIIGLRIPVYICLGQYFLRCTATDPIDIRQSNFRPFSPGQINTRNSSQRSTPFLGNRFSSKPGHDQRGW